MKLQHSDHRRDLFEWPVAKRLIVKSDCQVGGHWHAKKTELFVLTQGGGTAEFVSDVVEIVSMQIGQEYVVQPRTWHLFRLTANSVLICLASAPYDPEDEYTTCPCG